MTRALRLIFIAALLFVLLIGTSRLLGAQIYRQPALLARLDACATPCWHGIVLGETDVAAASAILKADGFVPVGATSENDLILRAGERDCWAALTFFFGQVTALRFSGCEAITIGDLMLTFGAPHNVITTGGPGDWWNWRDNLIEAGITGSISPHSRIDSLGFYAPSLSASTGTAWHGFVPFWRYCQLENYPYYACVGRVPGPT